MIAIILRQSDGNGAWTDRHGFTTGDTAVTVAGVSCIPGFIPDGGVSEWSHRVNVSRARGGIPEAITWSLDLVDWTGSVRRSVGILDGQAQFVGWSINLYTSTDGVSWSAAILGENHFRVRAAPVSGNTISLDCIEAWGLDSRTVGATTEGVAVGWAVGGMPVTVEVPEIADPVALEYLRPAGMCASPSTRWKAGVPGAPVDAGEVASRATSWDRSRLVFLCVDNAEAQTLAARMTALKASGKLIAVGEKHVEFPQDVAVSGATVRLKMTAGFASRETAAEKIAAVDTSIASFPVAYGAASVTGWGVNGAQSGAQGESSVSNFVLYFAPTILTGGGFVSFTRIPCSVRFDVNSTDSRPWDPDFGLGLEYTGNVESIDTVGNVGSYTSYNASTLEPTGTTGTVQAWGEAGGDEALYLRLSVEDQDSLSYDWLAVDVAARILASNDFGGSLPFCTDGILDIPGSGWIGDIFQCELACSGPALVRPSQTFKSFADLANAPPIAVRLENSPTFYNYEVLSLQLYGAKVIEPSGGWSVVQPGASRLWASPQSPSETAEDLAEDLDAYWTATTPSYQPSAGAWGRYIEPDTRIVDAATDIAAEFWTVMGPGGSGLDAGAEGELLVTPSITLGDDVDIITMPSVEFDLWAGEYRKRAYIAHVDEPYNSANPSRYYSGWGIYGLEIWQACRAAYLHHGILRAETMQSPGVRDEGVLGLMWATQRNGRKRVQWLALQSRYMTFHVRDTAPSWWAGNSVRVPRTLAGYAGYDLSEFASSDLIVTEKRWNPLTLETTFEAALPPAIPGAVGDVIVQTLAAGDNLIQQTLNAGDDLLSQVVQ